MYNLTQWIYFVLFICNLKILSWLACPFSSAKKNKDDIKKGYPLNRDIDKCYATSRNGYKIKQDLTTVFEQQLKEKDEQIEKQYKAYKDHLEGWRTKSNSLEHYVKELEANRKRYEPPVLAKWIIPKDNKIEILFDPHFTNDKPVFVIVLEGGSDENWRCWEVGWCSRFWEIRSWQRWKYLV